MCKTHSNAERVAPRREVPREVVLSIIMSQCYQQIAYNHQSRVEKRTHTGTRRLLPGIQLCHYLRPFVMVFSNLSPPRWGERSTNTCAVSSVLRDSAMRPTRASRSRAFRESSAGVKETGADPDGSGSLRPSEVYIRLMKLPNMLPAGSSWSV